MRLNQLVKINETALVANAVSFELMDDPDKNLRLCQGFVFNYDSDHNKLKSSTLGVLYALRRSFHSQNEPNVHLMVQDYGKGKSHFALAVANFFKNPYDSPEVQGILQQVEYATSSGNPILEGLKSYKKRSRHLVICLSGEKSIDLKKHFLQALKEALNSAGITDSIAQQICQEPLKYLENLDTEQRQKAEDFLKNQGNPDGDLNTLMQLLRDENYQIIPRVKAICRELTGVTPDFEADIDIQAILTDLVNSLCKGENPQFQGIIILFDELLAYLQFWANDPVRAGSNTLHSFTDICEKFKGKVALMSFTQRLPGRFTPSNNSEDYNKLVSRLDPSTYEPAASLELVLKGLLSQQDKTAAWQEFFSKWRDTLNAINSDIYENRTANFYKNRNWSIENFKTDITLGCFPLHPLTSYLLCNLDFTQGRTAIQFVQEDVKRFIQEQLVEKNGNINSIHPVTLVDAFEDNFSKSDYSSYSAYKQAYDAIVASAEPEELTVLKSLFLFYAGASTKKLTKLDNENHEEILILLSGMPSKKIKDVLHKLCKVREVIYHNPADNTYRFYTGGVNIQDLRKRIEEEIANINPSLDKVREYLPSNLPDTVSPTQFIEDNRLISSDWSFKSKVYTIAEFHKALSSNQLQNEQGIVAYVIAKTSEELAALNNEINQRLATSSGDLTSIKRRIAVAIALKPASDIARLLLMLNTAEGKKEQEFGAALTQLKQDLQKQIETKTKELFKSCIYHCHLADKLSVKERNNQSRVASAILKDLYPFVPPVEKIDKMALKSPTGGQIIGYVSKRLIENNLRPQDFNNKSYTTTVDTVFVKSWQLLKKSPQEYSIQEPRQPNIKEAWDKISQMTALGEGSQKTVKIVEIWRILSEPPYGYNEYTFTILFASWLSYNSSELLLEGSFGISQKKSEQVPTKREQIKNWANTNVFDKPKDFVKIWIEKSKSSIIRRKLSPCPEVPKSVNYEQAQQFIEEIDSFLGGAPDPEKIDEITNIKQQLISSIKQVESQFEPTVNAEELLKTIISANNIKDRLQLYTNLRKSLSKVDDNGLSVSPTEQQHNRRSEALQEIVESIGDTIETESQRAKSLNKVVDCEDYKSEIEDLTTQLSQVTDLPSRFTATLQEALFSANSRLSEITEQSKIEDCLSEIQKRYNTLSHLATQAEYIHTQSEIKQLVESVPAAKENDIYRSIIQSLEEKQDALISQIADWENQYSCSLSQAQAIQLNDQINQKFNRYTNESNKQKIQELLENLKIIIQRKNEEPEKAEPQQQQHKNEAIAWLASLEKQNAQLEKLTKFTQKLEMASQLFNNLKQRQQHENWLETQQMQIIEGIYTRCTEIQNQDVESRIFALFQELPRPQQKSLLQKLAEYLSGTKEKGDDARN